MISEDHHKFQMHVIKGHQSTTVTNIAYVALRRVILTNIATGYARYIEKSG